MEMGGKRFAVLLCAEGSDYVKKMYGGYFEVFVGMLAEKGETWKMYRVACGEFPDDEEIGLFDGFVITGSCNDAHGNDVWICKLLNLLKKLDSMKREKKKKKKKKKKKLWGYALDTNKSVLGSEGSEGSCVPLQREDAIEIHGGCDPVLGELSLSNSN